VLEKERRDDLFKYIWGVLKNKNCHLYRINGVKDHLHIITHIHPTQSVAGLVKDVKVSSGNFIQKKNQFAGFEGWQADYAAFTYKVNAVDNLIEYVKNQEEHHKKVSYRQELINLLNEHKIEFDDRYLF